MEWADPQLWLFASLLVYGAGVFAGYPVVVGLLARRFGRAGGDASAPAAPTSLSLVVPAHDEAAVIGRKLENAFSLDPPAGRFRVVVASDGSTDDTCEIVRRFRAALPAERRSQLELLDFRERRGKSAMLSEVVPSLDTELVVFTDANAYFQPDALQRLAARFADPEVGLVCGRLRYQPNIDSITGDEELYWRYEDRIKGWEGALGRLLVANGSIYAIRRELFEPFPGEVADDFVVPLRIASRGYRLVYEAGAVADEEIPSRGSENFRAKARIVTRGLTALSLEWRRVLATGPLRVLQYLLRKVARWLMFVLLLALYAVSALGADHPLLALALAGQTLFYLMGASALLFARRGPVPRLLRLPYYFLMVNIAAAGGLLDFLRGRRRATWEKSHSTRGQGADS